MKKLFTFKLGGSRGINYMGPSSYHQGAREYDTLAMGHPKCRGTRKIHAIGHPRAAGHVKYTQIGTPERQDT